MEIRMVIGRRLNLNGFPVVLYLIEYHKYSVLLSSTMCFGSHNCFVNVILC